ncbi:hypothetical protein MMYC01_202056 [Madurella mycetomatis]|uniref:EGF-like domain-containing protein n=1 Tax=Madurella mycetomatis TaxID=100816 RepID=A0A175WAV2_9PEZI|nr:hypothetical protein MMYC01_202056 [Madurella mycetomatis]
MNPQDGRDMDRPPPSGSVRRARERAAAGLPRQGTSPPRGRMDEEPQVARPSASRQPALGSTAGQPRTQRPQAPFTLQTKDGQIGVAISRPTQVPQWPLQGPIIAPTQADGEPYQPPPGKSQPPQRPPRPSRVPSILDASKVQDPTPSFQYRPRSGRESSNQDLLAVPETPSTQSRPSTLSSVGTIPDFPLPIQMPPGPPRRSVTLGPPPSARRGASSFYSNASYVSPIPEESPRSRSHASFASSAAMPERWGTPSPGPSPDYPEPIFAEAIAEETGPSGYGDDDAEESRLVRSASIGKRAKPTLVSATAARGPDRPDRDQRPGPQPIQTGPFKNGTGYVENSSSSSTIPTSSRLPIGAAVTADNMLSAYSSASADDPSSSSQRATPSPNPTAGGRAYSRLSAIRRPPRLDIDAVRKAESRGSLTSLPDLIRRATRLAASLEKGRRPASRFDDLDDFSGLDDYGVDGEKHRSGLSDMLAAFPPPAHPAAAQSRRSIRDSIREQVQSWPLPINFNRTLNTSQEAVPTSDSQRSGRKRGRRCCGLPLWGFIVVLIVVLVLIAAAVVIPVEFFVIRPQNAEREAREALQQCRQRLTCANGGTNVVNDGVCSCICSNGFTGSDCTVVDDTGCATVTLTGANNSNNVTVGDAIPRLIQQAQGNFSIPLSGSEVLAKLDASDLSCSAENALVTFDGRSTRQDASFAGVAGQVGVNAAVVNGVFFTTVTVMVGQFTTVTLDNPLAAASASGDGSDQSDQGTTFRTLITAPGTSRFATTISFGRSTPSPTATSTVTTTMSMTSGAPLPSATFTVDETVLDFARVAVLFILQEDSLAEAEAAQVTLQRFFSSANSGLGSFNSGVSVEAARNITVGSGKSVDLIDFVVDVGGPTGRVGGTSSAGA